MSARSHEQAPCPYCQKLCSYLRIIRLLGIRYFHKCQCGITFWYAYKDADDENPSVKVNAVCYFCDKSHCVEIHPPKLNKQHGTIIPCPKCWDEYECITWWDQMDEAITYPDDLPVIKKATDLAETK